MRYDEKIDLDWLARTHHEISRSTLNALHEQKMRKKENKTKLDASATAARSLDTLRVFAGGIQCDPGGNFIYELNAATAVQDLVISEKHYELRCESLIDALKTPAAVWIMTSRSSLHDGSYLRQVGAILKKELIAGQNNSPLLRATGTIWDTRSLKLDQLIAAVEVVYPHDAIQQIAKDRLQISAYEIKSIVVPAWWVLPALMFHHLPGWTRV